MIARLVHWLVCYMVDCLSVGFFNCLLRWLLIALLLCLFVCLFFAACLICLGGCVFVCLFLVCFCFVLRYCVLGSFAGYLIG